MFSFFSIYHYFQNVMSTGLHSFSFVVRILTSRPTREITVSDPIRDWFEGLCVLSPSRSRVFSRPLQANFFIVSLDVPQASMPHPVSSAFMVIFSTYSSLYRLSTSNTVI
jgi:hypothetical protein